LRICVVGKYPPIQGGVSMRTYRTAHALAARGHTVHVVTNATEVAPPFRMHMRPQDWQRCESYSGTGSVTAHWTDPPDRSQFHIPMSSPFVSKLAGIVARAHEEQRFDVIFSHYLEPYGVAGHLAAQITGAPHVVRMAGSDAGRLWQHPQLEATYDHVLRSANLVVAAGVIAERAIQRGVAREKVVTGGAYRVPDEFSPMGPALDLNVLCDEVAHDGDLRDMVWGCFSSDRPHFGVYGKLGENKGSFTLLAAMSHLKQDGFDVGLVAMAHGRLEVENKFRARVTELGLSDRVLQIPFLPHWRVPEFLRGCLAVCCLEQDFPIGFHSPIVPLEVLHCGSCLVASTEMIYKLPQWKRLPHGYGCVAVKDVHDVSELSDKLAAIVRQPKLAGCVGVRGRSFALACQESMEFPDRIEQILETAAQGRMAGLASHAASLNGSDGAEVALFPLTQIVAAHVGVKVRRNAMSGLKYARRVLAALENASATDKAVPSSFVIAVAAEIEIATALVEMEQQSSADELPDPLFRVQTNSWALDNRSLGNLIPLRDARMRILRFEHDLSVLQSVRTIEEFPRTVAPGPSYMVLAGGESLLVDHFTARFLELCDGLRTVDQLTAEMQEEFGRAAEANHISWIENLLVIGLIGARANEQSVAAARERSDSTQNRRR
jgi:glycosyltransferase involved in cell wall biosynthesis